MRELHLWRAVLSIYIKNVEFDRRDQSDNCLVSFGNFLTRKHAVDDVRHLPKVCDDSEIRLWLTAFMQVKTGQGKDAATSVEFARTLSQRRMEQEKLGEIFWYNGATWDYLDSLPSGPSVLELATHYLPLSEFAGFVKPKLGSR